MSIWQPITTLIVGAFLSSAASLDAQLPNQAALSESSNAAQRQRCTAGAQALAGSVKIRDLSSEKREQVRDLRQCRESAGAVLPQAWRVAQGDSIELMVLMDASSPIRDRRIAGVLESILADETKPSLVRQAAAVVLTNYVVRRFRGVVKSDSPKGGGLWIDPVEAAHVASENGLEPVDIGIRNRVTALIERMRATASPKTGMMYPLTNFLLTVLRDG